MFFYNPSQRTSVWEKPSDLVNRPEVDKLLEKAPEAVKKNLPDVSSDSESEEPATKKAKVEEGYESGKKNLIYSQAKLLNLIFCHRLQKEWHQWQTN